MTAHALETLGHEEGYDDAVERGLAWLLAEQEDDGSWFGRWGVNHLYGTGAALPALEACGVPSDHPAMRRASRWLDSVQQEHGGFGEDIRSYADPAWRGRARSRLRHKPRGHCSATWPQETLRMVCAEGSGLSLRGPAFRRRLG